MGIGKPKYKTLRELLSNELCPDEDEKTAPLMKTLRHVRKDKYLTKDELLVICRWKSPRAIRHCESNGAATIRRLTNQAFTTRSERKKIECLTELKGVSLPMASAILTLIWPERYGVIDIRVWQLLFALNSVRKNSKGVGFTFNQWYHYLCKLRYHAKELRTTVRAVERTLFLYHRQVQRGNLYNGK